MTDEQILVELARLMGWKIVPKRYNQGTFFSDPGNQPWYDPRFGLCSRPPMDRLHPWNPFTDWNDAMALAEKWVGADPANRFTSHDYVDGEYTWILNQQDYEHKDNYFEYTDPSGPRAVTMAVFKAIGGDPNEPIRHKHGAAQHQEERNELSRN